MQRTIVIIGLFTNMEFLKEALEDENLQVYAFEPNPDLVNEVKRNYTIPPNYHVIQKAVSDKSGKFMFNVCSNPSCSSLQEWGNGPQFGEMTKVEVECVTMKEFTEEHGIEEIEFIQIDTQGHDLYVMQGFEDRFGIIKKGVCESLAPHVSDWKLYDRQHPFRDYANFLEGKGYTYSWEYNIDNGCPGDEVNISFTRNEIA